MKRKLLALLLAFCLLLPLIPANARAADLDIRPLETGAALPEPALIGRVAEEPAQPDLMNKVTIYHTEGGTVTVKDEGAYDITIEAVPDEGYIFYGMVATAFSGDEAPWITYEGSYTFHVELPDSDVDIEVYFAQPQGEQHTISVEVVEAGGEVKLTQTKAYAGEQIFVDLEFQEHYSRAYVDPRPALMVSVLEHKHSEDRYEFLMPDCDVTVSVRFLQDQPVSLSCYSYGGGTIQLNRTEGYAGDTFRCMILPNYGYRINYIYAQDYNGLLPLTYVGGNMWEGTIRNDAGHVGIDVTFAESENPFLDVPDDSFYYDSVMWALEEGITTGTDMSHFDPNGTCLRAHVVTFLWRAAGCPEPESAVNPFTDVAENDFFYEAVLWAVENGITNGLSADTFGPYTACNRAQVVTFLWRGMGSPAAQSGENPFADVAADQWYTGAVLWAVENGITNGLSASEFGVNVACNRAQIVTFLYRMEQLPEQESPADPEEPTNP